MNIEIVKNNDRLMLRYSPSGNDDWIKDLLQNDELIKIKGVFFFKAEDLVRNEQVENSQQDFGDVEDSKKYVWYFQLGECGDDECYYRIPARILSSNHDVFVHKDAEVSVDYFMASVLKTRIVPIIDKMINCPLYIGGDKESSLPIDEYKALIKKLPNRDELHLYAQSRIEGVLAEYLPETRESSILLEEYIKRRFNRAKCTSDKSCAKEDKALYYIREIDCARISFTLNRMEELLDSENKLTEDQWQRQIEEIILLLLPGYMAKISQLRIPESTDRGHHRRIDIALVSISGNVDIIEVKRPKDGQLLSRCPNYRGNYIPSRDLSAAVMQAEKYLENLKRWGKDGEDVISKKINLSGVKIRNPKAILILGRTAELDNDQKLSDFEIIKRKFANMIDIITYDDLVVRLKNVLSQLKKKCKGEK